MRFKIDPELVRLIAMITAFVQTVGASLALAAPGAVPATVVLVIVAIGGGLQAALASYGQGIQTEPPHGMVTEEYAAKDAEVYAAPKGAEQPPGPRPEGLQDTLPISR